jgi:FtsP/CotA-like multicopper oxidase with cupredoxin domain
LREKELAMAVRNIYLKIERISDYSPVEPDDHVSPPIQYRRDCMRNMGHEDAKIPADEVAARRLTALIYREYLDSQYLVPKPDKLIAADINEPAFPRRVPGTVIYARPGDWLRIHVKNADGTPHSFHIHGVRYGIDSDGSWPFGTQSDDGRRSDEICPGQTWTYTYQVTNQTVGAWPFHDHCRNIGASVNRGLFGGLIVLPEHEHEHLPRFPFPPGFEKHVHEVLGRLKGKGSHSHTPHGATPPEMRPMRMTMRGPMPMSGGIPMGGAHPIADGGGERMQTPPELLPYLVTLDELAHAPQPLPPREHLLHVPLFFHQMSGFRGAPVFQSAPVNVGGVYTSPSFTLPATYQYICGIHGASMSGSVTVQAGGPSTAIVTIVDFAFNPAHVPVGIGGQVIWVNNGPSQHSVLERGGDNLPSFCFNGRSFVGNTPTIVAHAGQRIRWYVFNLDLGMNWHNFHPHGHHWQFANEFIDIRSIGPAESFIVETEAPPVLLLPPALAHCHVPHKGSKEYRLRGDFLVHCHVEMHMMQGLAALLRSHQTVHLTPQQAQEIGAEIGLALDPGDNACPIVTLDRCADAVGGRWEELSGLPQKTFMHAVLLPNSSRILFWGYDQPTNVDQTRLWDQTTGLYTQPINQPQSLAADENIWSGAHAHLDDAPGTILVHGGYHYNSNPPRTPNTERRAFLFDPVASNFAAAANVNIGRFYPTTIRIPDGRPLTLFGQDNASSGAPTVASFEIFTPGGAGSWSAPKPLPFNYFYYPWTFLLPGGDLFIAGPQKPARRFNPAPSPVVAQQFDQLTPQQRGVNMDGTAVLLPLRPPNYEPRVLIAGGTSDGANWTAAETNPLQSAEWIDLSVAAPAWQALPDMNVARRHLNSVLLPDGRVLILGGVEMPPDGGPVEIFDPEDPLSGFQLGPNMKYPRGYHSSAILMPDGSVIMGGDPSGGSIPNERYRPSYFFKPRPTLSVAPATIAHGAAFSVTTPTPGAIAEVILMSPGAVTHGFNQNQRYVGCTITGTTATTVQATAPADGTLAPRGYYLLFIVDQDRSPSRGRWVRLSP